MEIKIPNIESFLDSTKEDGEDAALNVRVEELCFLDILTKDPSHTQSIVLTKQQVVLLRDALDLIIRNKLMEDDKHD